MSLANFNHSLFFASKVLDNSLGLAVKRHFKHYGVATDLIIFDGPRLGFCFLENGVGERTSSVIYDRANSSFSEMDILEWSMDNLFHNVELLHISGITPAMSSNWGILTLQLMKEAKRRKVKISFHINYRAKLWTHSHAKSTLNASSIRRLLFGRQARCNSSFRY
ncbi:PfkB family carbohydrate kinase [Metabacillus iocasae]|uniref:PfkB family carbohydrate kinase n=1 Tax=Priestia iocasae TaxID=2291674 RepID=UPI001964182D